MHPGEVLRVWQVRQPHCECLMGGRGRWWPLEWEMPWEVDEGLDQGRLTQDKAQERLPPVTWLGAFFFLQSTSLDPSEGSAGSCSGATHTARASALASHTGKAPVLWESVLGTQVSWPGCGGSSPICCSSWNGRMLEWVGLLDSTYHPCVWSVPASQPEEGELSG